MSMNMKELASVLVDANKSAFKANTSRRAGQIFNDRIIGMVAPKLPMMVRGYKDEPWFKFVLANAVAGAVIKFGHTNDKLLMLADAGVSAANDEFLGSFNLEEMVNSVIDGIDTSGLTSTTNDVRGATAAGLRKASDIVDPDNKEGVA